MLVARGPCPLSNPDECVLGSRDLALVVFVWPAFAHAVEVRSTDTEFAATASSSRRWRSGCCGRSAESCGDGESGVRPRAGLVHRRAGRRLTLVSRRTGINVLAGVAVTPLLVGVAAVTCGRLVGRARGCLPAAFLVFGLGLYRGLLNSVGFALQDVTATGRPSPRNCWVLNLIRDGLVLQSAATPPEYAFVVAQACSGMSSLLALLTLAALFIYATTGPVLGKTGVLPQRRAAGDPGQHAARDAGPGTSPRCSARHSARILPRRVKLDSVRSGPRRHARRHHG